jgi:SAM-dependent methyltransferase
MKNLSYQDRLKIEINNFENALSQGGLANSIPSMFTYWASKYLSPRINSVFKTTDICSVFALEIIENSKISDVRPYRIISLGSGDCRTEINIARQLLTYGLDFKFICTEINPVVIEQAKKLCQDAGVFELFEYYLVDINENFPEVSFDAAMVNHALHHFVGLENIFQNLTNSLSPSGVFIVNDMIGRNGHMRWPEALPFVEQIWDFLPRQKRFNNQAKCYEDWSFVNYDCTTGGDFEGVRAQDILPLLNCFFHFSKFVAFGNILDVFIDRAYGGNFSPDSADDCRLIDYIERLNTHLIDIGIIKPTMMIASLKKQKSTCCYDRWPPEYSIRNPEL